MKKNHFARGKITITDEAGNQIGEIIEFNSSSETTFNLSNIEDFVKYNVQIDVSYDLDSNKDDNQNKGTICVKDEFELIGNYNFAIKDFKVYKIDTENNKIILNIEGSLTEQAKDTYQISKVIINGETYDITEVNGDIYTVEIPYTSTSKQELVLQETILNNSQGFEVKEKSVVVFKEAPTAIVHSTVLRDSTQEWLKNITATVKINDPDRTISKGKIHARLLDLSNREIAKKEKIIDLEDSHEAETILDFVTEEPYDAGTYTIEVYADFDRVDGNTYENTTIGMAKVTVLKYANIEKAIAKQYVQKGEEFEITYTVNSNTDEDVTGIIINNETYVPTKNEDGTYTVKLTAGENAGTTEYNVTRLIYNDSQVSAPNTVVVHVLKDVKPTVEGVSVNDDSPKKTVLSFNIIDPEDTFVKGKVIITGENQDVITVDINSKDETTIELQDIEELVEYNLTIEVTYDLDGDKNDEANQVTEKLAESTFEIEENYEFTLSDYKLDRIDKDRKVIIVKFVSTNSSERYDIKSVMINGLEYSVTQGENHTYTVEIPYNDPTRQELELQEVILDNLKGFTDFEVEKIVVFKEKPIATVDAQISEDLKTIKATFNIADTESLIQSLSIKLLNEKGEVVDTKIIDKTTNGEIIFNRENDEIFEQGKYTIKLFADYDAVDGDPKGEKVIAETFVKFDIKVKLLESQLESYYVEKGQDVKITYTIDVNTNKQIQSLIINNETVIPQKTSDGKYQVTVKAPENYGTFAYNLTEIVYSKNEKITVSNDTIIEVLKDKKPKIDNLAINTDAQKPKLSFTITDEENTFISGKIVITEENGAQTQEPIIFDSKENLIFDLENTEETKNYNVKIYITYDFDSDKNSEENQVKEELFKEHNFVVRREHEFKFSNLKVKEITPENIILEFESTLIKGEGDTCYLEKIVINGTSYNVISQDDNKYTVQIPYTEKTRTELKVEKALLNTLHEFEISDEKVVVFKTVTAIVIPTVSDDLKSISVYTKITDEDQIAKDIYVVLANGQKEIERKAINSYEENIAFENIEGFDAGNYTVNIIATYDAEDGLTTHENEILVTAEAKVSISANIEESTEPKYAKKGEEIEVQYKLKTNSIAKASSIVVNDLVCEVEEVIEDTYKVKVYMPSEAGITDLNVTKVNFENGESVDIIYKSQVEVLKSIAPIVGNITIDDTGINPVLSFTVTDIEDTFVNGTIIIKDVNENTSNEIPFNTITNTSFALEGIKEFTEYEIQIKITYDLDSNKADSEHQETKILAEKSFEIIKEYEFNLDDLKVSQIDREGKKAILEFTSTNASENEKYYVDRVTINGNLYKATKQEDNKYIVEVPYEDEVRRELILESARLNNLKEFTGLSKQVVIFKDKPQAEVNVVVKEDLSEITAQINLTDKDNSLVDLNARLINPKGETIITKDIDNNATSITFLPLENGIFKAGEYTVEIGADYDIVDGLTHISKETIGTANVKVQTKASITKAEVQNYYVQKGENVNIKYTFESNNDINPTGINIDEIFYQATQNEDGTYSVSIPADSTSYGEKALKVTIAIFGDETTVLEEAQDAKYYVLKDKPSIEKYDFSEFVKDQTLTFELKNTDNVKIKNPEVVISNDEKEIRKELNTQVQEGEQTARTVIELNELESGVYKVKLSGTYDRDDTEDETNVYELSEIFDETTINVTSSYGAQISITNIEVKNKQVNITFTSTNTSNLEVKKIIVDGKEIEVTKLATPENTYTATIPYENENNQLITIQKVVVEYDIQIDLTENNSFEIFKTKPKVQNIETEIQEGKLHVKYQLSDTARIAKNIKAIITKGEFKQEKLIENAENKEVVFDNITSAGTYTIEFLADFDCADGKEHLQEKINEKDITYELTIEPTITLESISNYYPTKNETITLKYKITSNTDETITALTIDGTDYPVSNENYEVQLNAPGEKGDKTYKVTSVKYGDKSIDVSNEDAKIYVLKDKPEINNYNLKLDERKITFNLDKKDAEDSDINGTVIVLDGEQEKQSQDLKIGENVIDLSSVEYDDEKSYKIVLRGTYNLDDNKDDDKNVHQLSDLFEEQFQLRIDTKLAFENFSTHYPERNTPVEITFKVKETNTTIPISQIYVGETAYSVESAGEGIYKIKYIAKSEPGIEELNVSKVKHGDNEVNIEKITDKLDILKQKPRVPMNFEIDENYEARTITFNFKLEDNENAIIKEGDELKAYVSYAGYTDENGRNRIPLTVGDNSVTFINVPELTFNLLTVTADYDLDTDTLNEMLEGKDENQVINGALMRVGAGLIPASKLDIKDIQVQDVATGEKGKYIDKNEEFKISFTSQTYLGSLEGKPVSYYPVSAMINGQYYELEKSENTYTTKENLKGYENSGKQKITIESITLNNKEVVNENVEGTIEVLKSKLAVNKFEVNTNYETKKATATIKIQDDDDSFVSGKIVLKDTENIEELKEVQIKKDQESYELTVTPFKKYTVELFITYDLDEDKVVDSQNYKEESFGTANIELITDYELNISDLIVTKVDQSLATATLQFKATNVSSHKISFVKVEGKGDYTGVGETGEPNTYTFEYQIDREKMTANERIEIKLERVQLDNKTELDVNEEVKAVIFKKHPTVDSLNIEVQENMKIVAHFDITDTDSTLKNLYVSLKDSEGNEIGEQSLDTTVRESTFDITDPDEYKVVIRATYDAIDGLEHIKEELKTSDETATITPNAKIIESTVANKYPKKGETIDVTYKIAANIEDIPTKLIVNDTQECELIPTGEAGTYKISYTVPSVAGIQDIDVTKIHYGDTKIVELQERNELQVDVLKDVPTYKITSTEFLEQEKVVFQIDVIDEDGAMTKGEANVHEEHKSLNKGQNIMQVDVELDTEHTLTIDIDYDLDSNKIPEETEQNVSRITHSQKFALVSDYGLEINNLRAVEKDTDKPVKYVKKGEQIQLKFESTNNTTLTPIRVNLNDMQNEGSEGNLYEVHKVDGKENEYYIDVTVNSTPGTQKFEITDVQLSSSKMINKKQISFIGDAPIITVLKEKPTMEDYKSANNETSVTVTFTIKDPDEALDKDSKIKLIDEAENKELKTFELSNGLNTHVFEDLQPGKRYKIEVQNKYSLSDDGKNNDLEIFKTDIIEITKKEEPNFKAKHLTISKRVPIGQKVQISFENAVMSYKDADEVTIDNTVHKISKDKDGVYRLTLEPAEQKGVNTIQVQNAKIEGKEFPINRPLSYTNEFTVPEAIDVTDIREDGGKAIVNYKLKDPDNSIKNLTLYMKTSSGAVVAKAEIKEGYTSDGETVNQVEMPLLKLNRYSLELKATCDIGDGTTLEEKNLFEKSKDSPAQVAIIENLIDKEYVEKGEEVVLTFKINTNVDGDVKKIYINEDQYNVEKVLDDKNKVVPDTYTVKVEAPKTSGIFEQKVTSMDIGSEFIENVSYSSEIADKIVAIKVLKDIPTVTHFKVNEQDSKITFKVNDADEALLDDTSSKLIVIKDKEEISSNEIKKRKQDYNVEEYNGSDYELSFNSIGINAKNYPDKYQIKVNSTYDRRPDAVYKVSIFQKVKNFFTGNKNEVKTIAEQEPTLEDENPKEGQEESIKEENIFIQNIELTGKDIKYDIQFNDYPGWYLFNLKTPTAVQFECSTGTQYKVEKVIFEGKEYPVTVYRTPEENNGKYIYEFGYIPKDYAQETVSYQSIILENGAAFDVTGMAICMVIQADPTFNLKTFSEDLYDRKVRFGYKFVDDDNKVKGKLKFTLSDSQGKILEEKYPERDQDMVEFNIPDPPTSVYKLSVTADVYQVLGLDYTVVWSAYNGEHKSNVTTSILSSDISNKYPKKGETIDIIYNISSTKVVLVDKDDHSNQDKAVGISKMVINGVESNVETLDPEEFGNEKYRIYYTAQSDDGIEDINVSKIIFTNGDEEIFERKDQIEILKDAPQVTDFTAKNDINNNQVKFKFRVSDPDNVIVTDGTDIYAEVNGEKQGVSTETENELTFNVKLDELTNFEIKANYDLDSDSLKTESDENVYNEYTIFKKQFVLTGQYDIDFTDIKKYNSKGEETDYFEKNEDIRITYKCQTKWPEIYPEIITINNQDYRPEKVENEENTYTFTVKADENAGQSKITFDKVILSSGNEVPLAGKEITYEVLKDKVTVDNFSYTIADDNDKIELQIDIKDEDKANQELTLEIKDEYDKSIEINQGLEVGKNTLEFTKTTAGKYFATVYSTYDRDTDNSNLTNNAIKERIHYEIITVNTRYIEMKDIVDIELYKFGNTGKTERVDTITPENLEPVENCIVKVIMKDIPEFYSKIASYKVEDNKLKLILEYSDAMVFTGDEKLKPLEVSLDIIGTEESKEYQYENSFKSLVDKMRAHPEDTYTLTKDYDLKEYVTNNNDSVSILDFEFKGKLNGNGHRIYNAGKPIFDTLKGATVENLVISEPVSKLTRETGIIAKTIDNSIIKNIHIENPVCEFQNAAGIIAREIKNNSTIENCSINNITGNYNGYAQQTSAFAFIVSNSTIKNCYVQGKISGGWHFNAGFIKEAGKGTKIINNIIDLSYTPAWSNDECGNGAVVWESKEALFQNNLFLINTSKASLPYNRGSADKNSANNYYLDEYTGPKNQNANGIDTISREEITADFIINKLGFSSEYWNIPEDTSIDNLPTLKGKSKSYIDEGEKPENSQVYIPDYNRVSKLSDYHKEREITYNNMYKIMPFYDAKELINDGNKIPEGNALNTKIIKYIIAYNKEGNMVTCLTTEDYNKLDKISVVFEDGTRQEYHIDFDDYYGNVASYMITDLKIGYNYNRYVVNTQLPIIKQLVEKAKSYEFNKDLEPLTTIEESRLYKEHFEKETKNHIQEFVINSLVNLGYTPTFESDVLNYKIQQEFTDTNKLKELLFTYNYITYWYDLDMKGVNVADAFMFQSNQMFDHRMNMEYMASKLLIDNTSATNGIAGYFNNNFTSYTLCKNLGYFLDHFVTHLTDYKDGNEWFKANFKGGIYETVDIGYPGVDYTIWDHVKKDGKVQNDILPALTVPEDSMLIVSSPTQVYFSSLRVYLKNPKDPAQIAQLKKEKLNLFMDQIKQFYTFGYNFWGKDTLNKYCDVQYDMRTTYTGRGNETVYNNPYSTEENYHKYFIEAIGRWAGTSGGAYANGSEVFWNVIKMLDGGFRVATHETLHNQDNKIFLDGYGRRGGAEDYAAGFIQQYYRDGWVSPNIFDEIPNSDNKTQNLYRSTVENDEKLGKFYKNYFRTNDFLDYIEAQAFFKLTDEEKTKLVTQVSYPEVTDQNAGHSRVAYQPLTQDTVTKMNLTSLEALWDNRIMLRPGNNGYEVRSPGADTDSIYNIHWYQPHADNDRPDGANFKYLAWQMAGERGYYDGFCAYYSQTYVGKHSNRPNLKTTDLEALRYIMNSETITYRDYKLNRYNELSQYFNKQGTYINAQDIYNKYLTALKLDAQRNDRKLTASTAVKRDNFIAIRAATKDFTIDPFENIEGTTKGESEEQLSNISITKKIEQEEKITEELDKEVEENVESMEQSSIPSTNEMNAIPQENKSTGENISNELNVTEGNE